MKTTPAIAEYCLLNFKFSEIHWGGTPGQRPFAKRVACNRQGDSTSGQQFPMSHKPEVVNHAYI
jgi:hypothetical protein